MTVGERRYVMPTTPGANMAKRREILLAAAKDPALRWQLRDACSKDIVFWVNCFGFTYDPRKAQPVLPFITYPFQAEAMEDLVSAIRHGEDVGIKKSRDMGASWINLTVFYWLFHFVEMQSLLMFSRNEAYVDASGDSKSLFWKIDFLRKHEPDWLKPRVTRRSMHIGNDDNGSIIDGQATTGDAGRGDRRTAALIDEFAAFDPVMGYDVLKATRDMTNCRVFNSTPKGANNAFYDVIHKLNCKIISMHWSKHPEKSRGLYTSVRKDDRSPWELKLLDGWQGTVDVRDAGDATKRAVRFPSEYPFVLDGKVRSPWYDLQCSRCATPAEISQELDIDFLGSDFQFFDPRAVEKYKTLFCREPLCYCDLEYNTDTLEPHGVAVSAKGLLALWVQLEDGVRVKVGRKFVMGVDVSAGTGASNSTVAVYELGTNEKAAEYANPNVLPADFAKFCVALARFFNGALIVPDRSGPTGEVFVKGLQDCGYYEIYRRHNDKKIGREVVQEYGVFLNPQAKTAILHEYRSAIADNTIVNRSERAMDETLQFITKMDGSIEHSAAANAKDPTNARAAHGDIVIGDALANVALKDPLVQQQMEQRQPEIPPDSVMGRMLAHKAAMAVDANTELGKGWE